MSCIIMYDYKDKFKKQGENILIAWQTPISVRA